MLLYNKQKHAIIQYVMSQNKNVPTIYTTDENSARRRADFFRGHDTSLRGEVEEATARAGRLREVLSATGVMLESVSDPPSGIGLEYGAFMTVGRSVNRVEELANARLMVPEMPTVEPVPFSDDVLCGVTLPFVVKDWRCQRGERKYLINRPDQVGTLYAYATDADNKYKQDSLIIERFIEPPKGYVGTFRVMVDVTGNVLCASLLAREIDAKQPKMAPSLDYRDDLGSRDSEYFLDSDEFRSNVAQGGILIPLAIKLEEQPPVVDFNGKRKMLKAFGIDRKSLACPPEMLAWAKILGRTLGPKTSIVIGLDFVADRAGQYPLLEINAVPGVLDYRLTRRIPENVSDEEVYDMIYAEVGRRISSLAPHMELHDPVKTSQ